jgi:hypothetical protein
MDFKGETGQGGAGAKFSYVYSVGAHFEFWQRH